VSARCHAIANVSPRALAAALVTVTAKFVTALPITVTTRQKALPVPEVARAGRRPEGD
jgi:hypothetical protein